MQTRAKQVIEATKLAWAAGFIDGEGYIGIIRQMTKGRWYYRPAIDVAQSRPAPILLLHDLFNVGRVVKQTAWNNTTVYHWVLTGPVQINDVLEQLIPYFIVKRQQAEYIIQFRKTVVPRGNKGRFAHLPDAVFAEREAIWAAVKTLNTVQADRLSEKAPQTEGDAIVGSHGNDNHESATEMIAPSTIN